MKELINIITHANMAYYSLDYPIMIDRQYDLLYDELKTLEKELDITLSNSPTQKVGSEVVGELQKLKHNKPMLSLDKTKDINALTKWLGDKEGLISWKKDGLSVSLTYENGKLLTAVTRGDGETGEDITHNAKVFSNIPLTICYKNRLEIRGEAVISYSVFDYINEQRVKNGEESFKTPRNLASGTVRQLDNKISKQRNLMLFAFDTSLKLKKKSDSLNWLEEMGFQVVESVIVNAKTLKSTVDSMNPLQYEYPVDGLVLTYNDTEYSNSLGSTSRYPLHSIAYKFFDNAYETEYSHTEVETGRTGIATPTAVFKTVDIDGTAVNRASCHNIDVWEGLQLGKGDKVTVYKANMIIPQIDDNLTRSGTDRLPTHCSSCGSEYIIYKPKKARFLKCINLECPAQFLNKLTHFVSRDCMNIAGLSKETLEKLVEVDMIKDYSDIYTISDYKSTIVNMEGFGLLSYNKLTKGINNSKIVELHSLINALGIKLVGLSTAKLIAKAFNNNIEEIQSLSYDKLIAVSGIGNETAKEFVNYFADINNKNTFEKLLSHLTIVKASEEIDIDTQKLNGLIFCVTGEVSKYKNRKELESHIERLGGTVSSSVSSKTSYLINNDKTSTSGKNKNAMDIQSKGGKIKIITEAEFLDMVK